MKTIPEPSEWNIARNYQQVLDRIALSAQLANRNPENIRLVVVTKGQALEKVKAVIDAGAKILGENYVEEALPKMRAISPKANVEWHMIGHVQSRKARGVCENFSYLHSLDSVKLARRLNHFAQELKCNIPVLLECNVSGEDTKYGWQASQEDHWPKLLPEFGQILELPNINVRGLMTMAPFLDDPEGTRPYFKRLHNLKGYLMEHSILGDWSELSMGMSADFEVAIQEGATMVRIGTAIMGERKKLKGGKKIKT